MNVLEIDGLTKSYGSILAVNKLQLKVESGQIFGILGPNGSGKTTTLGMIMGIIRPNSGSFSWFGAPDSAKSRKRIGTLLETPNFYPFMSATQNLKIVAHIKKVKEPRIDELLKLVRLYQRKDYAFKTFSLGMKQRLAIAAGLIGQPDVLIFDEPTNGLDPEGIAEVRSLILEIANRGKTIIMASHILDEVEKTCSHVAIIKSGKLLAQGSVGAIINAAPTVEVSAPDLSKLRSILESQPSVQNIDGDEGKLILTLEAEMSPEALNVWLHQKGISLNHLVLKKRSLEEEFLEITKEQPEV